MSVVGMRAASTSAALYWFGSSHVTQDNQVLQGPSTGADRGQHYRQGAAPDAVVRVPIVAHVLERQLPLLLQLLQELLPRCVRPRRRQYLRRRGRLPFRRLCFRWLTFCRWLPFGRGQSCCWCRSVERRRWHFVASRLCCSHCDHRTARGSHLQVPCTRSNMS